MSTHVERIAIVTDSMCDMPEDLRQKHNIHVVPLYIIWGEEALRDGTDIDNETFYKRLPVDPVHPQTSQPSVGDFVETYEKVGQQADEIVAILTSRELSGTIASAEEAREMVDIPVHILDTRSITLGLTAAILAAAEVREAGGGPEEMLAAAETRARSTRIVFAVDTLEYLHKGGRIGGAAKFLGTALNMKPVLELRDGRIEALERVRTRSKALARLLEVSVDGLDLDAPLGGGVLHGAAPEDAAKVAEQYKELYQPEEFIIGEVTPVIGVHTGPGVVGIVSYAI